MEDCDNLVIDYQVGSLTGLVVEWMVVRWTTVILFMEDLFSFPQFFPNGTIHCPQNLLTVVSVIVTEVITPRLSAAFSTLTSSMFSRCNRPLSVHHAAFNQPLNRLRLDVPAAKIYCDNLG